MPLATDSMREQARHLQEAVSRFKLAADAHGYAGHGAPHMAATGAGKLALGAA